MIGRRQLGLLLTGVATGLLVWSASSELAEPARLLVTILLGPAPAAFILQGSALTHFPEPLPRIRVYTATIVFLWVVALVTAAAARASGFTSSLLGLRTLPVASLLGWSLAVVVAICLIVIGLRALGLRESELMRQLIPVSGREKALFVLLSVTAGVCEEFVFRSFLIPALTVATGLWPLAVILAAAVFGLLHAHQHAGGAARAAVLGLLLSVPLLVTNSIYPSMIAHVLIDLVAGLWLARRLLG